MNYWQTKSSAVVYDTPWFKIYRDEILNHNKKPMTYSYMKLPYPPVTIIAVNEQDQILLQKNYRYVIGETVWEVPAGHSDGQDPLEAAKRELLEETGLESDNWSSLGEARLALGVADVHHYIFLARNVRQVTDERDEDELITDQRFFPLDEVRKMILQNEIVDGDSLVGLCRFIMQNEDNNKKR